MIVVKPFVKVGISNYKSVIRISLFFVSWTMELNPTEPPCHSIKNSHVNFDVKIEKVVQLKFM